MITSVKTSTGAEAITSDHWHVVHARFLGAGKRPFSRSVSSEHEDRASCAKAATALMAKLRVDSKAVPVDERDQVFVRRPGFKSLKLSKRREKRSRPLPPENNNGA
jgi:hypothetical protein